MSTRTAKDDAVFNQSRYASSPEFERGLIANLVAKRCALLGAKADRELVWFVQYLSHQPGGLASVAAELIARFADRLGTATMAKFSKADAQNFSAAEIREIRLELPRQLRRRFLLRGETPSAISAISDSKFELLGRRLSESARRARQLSQFAEDALSNLEMDNEKQAARNAEERAEAEKRPSTYPVAALHELCERAAAQGMPELSDDKYRETHKLERELAEMCLDPEWNFEAGGPWYFAALVDVLREYQTQWIAEKSKVVVTTLGKRVCDALDYCAASRSLVLQEGNARLGKTFSARAWCEQHPGKARFVEVPWGNDEKTFFHALARGLGLGSFLNYKVVEIRQRVESVLLAGDLVLVMDEGQRLFPQRNFRCAFPGRVVWVMTMANAGVPIGIVSTPQFILSQKAMEKAGWQSAQLTGRIGHYEFLPTELTLADLKAVARAVLPEASAEVLEVLASYARMSARYLAAVDSIAKRAQFIAQRNGRAQCTAGDVRTAMQESVIPSDTMLVRTLEQARKTPSRGRTLTPMLPAEIEIESPTATRETRPAIAAPAALQRRAAAVELVQT